MVNCPPPLFSAQPSSVGRFHLRETRTTRGFPQFCACDDSALWPSKVGSSTLLRSLFSTRAFELLSVADAERLQNQGLMRV